MTSLILEVVLVSLLLGACGIGFVLNRRLDRLRADQRDLMGAIERFDAASIRAEQNLAQMKARGTMMERTLGKTVTRANFLIDELTVMVNAGDHIAGRIEGVMEEVRGVGRAPVTTNRYTVKRETYHDQ